MSRSGGKLAPEVNRYVMSPIALLFLSPSPRATYPMEQSCDLRHAQCENMRYLNTFNIY